MVAILAAAALAAPYRVVVAHGVRVPGVNLQGLVSAAATKAFARLPHRGVVTIYVRDDVSSVIPQVGVGGFTDPRTGKVYLDVDESRPHDVRVFLPQTVAHELDHSSRIRTGPGYGTTLGEAMVSEGLADRFAHQLYPHVSVPWDRALTKAQEREVWPAAVPQLHERTYSHAEWFFGVGRPQWTGYTLGWDMVGRYLRRHHLTADAAVDLPASKILAGFHP